MQLEVMIADVIDRYIHLVRVHPRAKRWWSRELTTKRLEVKGAAKKARAVMGIVGHPDTERYQ